MKYTLFSVTMPKNDNPSSPNTSSPDDTKEQHYELRNRQVRRESVETEYSDGASSFEDVTTSAAEEEFDEENFTQLLSQLFPSEYLKEKNNSRKKKGNKKRKSVDSS